MRPRTWILLLALAPFGAACENYTSEVPLAWSGVAPFDERLSGFWMERGDSLALEVLQLGPTEYIVLKFATAGMASDTGVGTGPLLSTAPEPYRAFLTDLAATRFVNVQELRSSPERYMLFRIELTAADSLVLKPVRNCDGCPALPRFQSSRELREFIRSNLANDSIFGPAMVYGRIRLADPDSGSAPGT